jgi:Phage tail tube protein, TTP
MGDITTASGTRVYIGAAVTTTAADSLAEFQAMASAWVEIGLIESLGEFGDESADVAFAAIGDGRTRHAKGARDAGTMAITAAHDPTDVGQAAIEAAEQTNNNYAFRVVLPDGPPNYSDTEIFFRGLVRSRRKNIGTNDNVIRNTYNVGVNSELFTQPAVSA